MTLSEQVAELEKQRALLQDIKNHAISADGWEDGETFYKSAIERIRHILEEAGV